MKKINLDDIFDVKKLVSEIVDRLGEGEIVLLPLDAGYGILVSAKFENQVEKCRELLAGNNSEALLISDKVKLFSLLDSSEVVQELIEGYLPGLLLLQADGAGLNEGEAVRVRFPEHFLLNQIADNFKDELLVFEANKSDKPPVYDLEQIETDSDYMNLVDFCLDAGILNLVTLPTSIKVDDNQLVILREGKLVPKLVVQFSIKLVD